MQVNLSKNSWHSKLFKWTIGKYPTHGNLCPYFWTTIFFMFASPFVLAFRVITFPLKFIASKIGTAVRKYNAAHPPKPYVYKPYVKSKLSRFLEAVFGPIEAFFESPLTEKVAKKIGKVIAYLFCITFFVIIIYGLVTMTAKNGILLILVVGTLAILGLIVWAVISFFDSAAWGFIVNSVLMFKNKMCPAIDWKE